MGSVPARVAARVKDGLKRLQPIIEQAKTRDVGEADTSTLVKDILSDIFGYDRYTEITAEFQIKGTYCDLAIKIDNKLALLVEVKAINLDLKEAFVKQAVDYAANQGVEWVVLTNAQIWQVYRISFGKPITQELLISLDLSKVNHKNEDDLETIYLLSREAQGKSLLDEYHVQRQALSRFFVGAIVLSEPVVTTIRRELKRISPDVRIDLEEITHVLTQEVLKREVLEGEKAIEAQKKVAKAAAKAQKAKAERATNADSGTGDIGSEAAASDS